MAFLTPTSLHLITPEWVDKVPAPAHDSMSPAERRRYMAEHPDSYLAVNQSPEDLPTGEVWDPALALQRSRMQLDRLIEQGVFGPVSPAGFYLYQLSQDDHHQIGIVACVSTEEYDHGQIRIHEQIRDDLAEHLATQLGGLGVQASPIALAYRPNAAIGAAIDDVVHATEPVVDFEAADGVRQRVWRVNDEAVGRILQEALTSARLYLIDGHHRAAAISKLRQRFPGTDADLILAAVYSADDLRTAAFHRVMPGTPGERLLTELSTRFETRRAADLVDVAARRPNELALLIPEPNRGPNWYLVTLPDRAPSGSKAEELLGGLEPVRLEQEILGPLLELDPRLSGERIAYRHGLGDRDDLERLEIEAADPVWVMRPISVETVMAASDLGAVMPPKSTYFAPKVRSGVFLRPLRTST